MAVRKPGARKSSKSAAKSASNPSRARGGASASATTRAGRERQNLLVNRETLQRAMAALGTTNMSETVNVALDRLAEDAAILQGLEAAAGAIPDFPYLDT
jgi:Arc/MetJ family transcription regulator